jgi:Zn-dependent peptidase ImmA (M78 family)
MYQHAFRKKIIHINSNLQPHMQRQVCAHELGHALIHKKVNTVFWDTHTFLCTSKLEMEANMFAAELLIADSELSQCEGFSSSQMASAFGVQEQLVKYKIKNNAL